MPGNLRRQFLANAADGVMRRQLRLFALCSWLSALCSPLSALRPRRRRRFALRSRHLLGAAVDQLLAQEDVTESLSLPDRVLWPLTDHLQTTRDLIDNAGDLSEHYEYDSFGRLVAGDPSLTRYLFTAREHDPATGRWLSEDPIGFEGRDANVSRYVSNVVLALRDPSGMHEAVGGGPPVEPWPGFPFTRPDPLEVLEYQRRTEQAIHELYPDPRQTYLGPATPGVNVFPTMQAAWRHQMRQLGYSDAMISLSAFFAPPGFYNANQVTFTDVVLLLGVGTPAAYPRPLNPGGSISPSFRQPISVVAPQDPTRNPGRLMYCPTTKSWQSTVGLVYGQGSQHGNRVRHVLAHLVPNPGKEPHTVFNCQRTQLIGLLDEAWQARSGPGLLQNNGRRVFAVNMDREVGLNGERFVEIIVRDGTTNVITAYPKVRVGSP